MVKIKQDKGKKDKKVGRCQGERSPLSRKTKKTNFQSICEE